MKASPWVLHKNSLLIILNIIAIASFYHSILIAMTKTPSQWVSWPDSNAALYRVVYNWDIVGFIIWIQPCSKGALHDSKVEKTSFQWFWIWAALDKICWRISSLIFSLSLTLIQNMPYRHCWHPKEKQILESKVSGFPYWQIYFLHGFGDLPLS